MKIRLCLILLGVFSFLPARSSELELIKSVLIGNSLGYFTKYSLTGLQEVKNILGNMNVDRVADSAFCSCNFVYGPTAFMINVPNYFVTKYIRSSKLTEGDKNSGKNFLAQ